MHYRLTATALAASVLLLAGCATPSPVPPGATDEEAERVVAEELVNYWSALGPGQANGRLVAERIAFTTRDSWASAQVSCLIAAGLDAREVSGGFAIDSNGELSNAEGLDAQLTCLGQYPVDPRTEGFLSDAQALYMYDYFTQRLVPCLELLGYAIPPAPARDSYVHLLRVGVPWTPYELADRAPLSTLGSDWKIINAKCPPLPADPFSDFQPPDFG